MSKPDNFSYFLESKLFVELICIFDYDKYTMIKSKLLNNELKAIQFACCFKFRINFFFLFVRNIQSRSMVAVRPYTLPVNFGYFPIIERFGNAKLAKNLV